MGHSYLQMSNKINLHLFYLLTQSIFESPKALPKFFAFKNTLEQSIGINAHHTLSKVFNCQQSKSSLLKKIMPPDKYRGLTQKAYAFPQDFFNLSFF